MKQDTLSLKVQQLESAFPERLVQLPDGSQVAWREAGDTDAEFAVVLLHGISSGSASWLDVARPLSDKVRVLAWDAPGYGISTPLAQPAPLDADYARSLARSLSVLGVRRCILVGHSLGALMAAKLACTDASGLVAQLVLISPAGGYGASAKAEQQAKVRQGRLASLAEKGVAGLAAVIDQRLVSAAAPEAVREWVRWNTARMQSPGYAQAVELLCGSDLGQATGRLPMPVQVWVGEHDVVTPPAACKAWAELLDAHYGTLAAAGHASPVEQPGEIVQRLAFLLDHSA
ncbi:MAG: alpha/beta hydrolase [Comamonas sp.]|jgi:pimeloyl-ACP methyl ester carboxylesterase|uniref:alpha/beta fold hydrolase n=1 Tax=Comamonas sp. TaxID=34028 RepID=UPI002829E823|nr:alpha/beta hydrolase [Comamonas sp.]MDR0213405.1 alpha/beta hydrolase [Comamonas sp.]